MHIVGRFSVRPLVEIGGHAITVPPRTHNHSSCLPLPPSLPHPGRLACSPSVQSVMWLVKPNEPFRGRAERKEVVARIIAPDVQTSERAREHHRHRRAPPPPLPSPDTDTVMSPLGVRNSVGNRPKKPPKLEKISLQINGCFGGGLFY